MTISLLSGLSSVTVAATRAELRWCIDAARAPRVRTLRQFAAEEIVIPRGDYAGWKWRPERQPYAPLLLDLMQQGPWRRHAIFGCVQAGKTFQALVIPVLYDLFELKESVVVGAPTMQIAHDKWEDELLPTIRRTRFAELMPSHGAGSKGGSKVGEITFLHGVKLKFMSGRGGDETRSGFTAKSVRATEVDKFDTASRCSRETDPIGQLEGRTESYGERGEITMECTVSIRSGRIWTEYLAGTATRIIHPCPHCARLVSPEREHLHGWQNAASKILAMREAYFCCPACGERLSPAQRVEMVARSQVIHRGQELTPDGRRVVGPPAETDTLGFRWSAFQNMFWSVAHIAGKEWAGARAEDEENAKKALLQFTWAVPYEPPLWEETPISAEQIRKRFGAETKGLVPDATQCFTVGVDLGKRVGYWVAIAWLEDGSSHIVDYGTFEIASDDLGVERAMLAALRDFKEMIEAGWGTRSGEARVPDQVWIDARYQGESSRLPGHRGKPVYGFIREQGKSRRFRPAIGFGSGKSYPRQYRRPRKTGAEVKHVGDGYHITWMPKDRVFVAEVNADAWKSGLHERLATPTDQPGAMRLFASTDPNQHITIAKHFDAEKIEWEFKPGEGLVGHWVRHSRANHYLDAASLACAAGHLAGARILREPAPTSPGPTKSRGTPVRAPDGRPFLITER